jgi:hypothetical protein
MNRFLLLYGTIEEMQCSLVWLPTWTQCMRLLREHWYADPEEKQAMLVKTGGDLDRLYRVCLSGKQGTNRCSRTVCADDKRASLQTHDRIARHRITAGRGTWHQCASAGAPYG